MIRDLERYMQVGDVGRAKWSVSYSDCEDRDAAKQELRAVLDEIEKDWRFVVMIA